MAKYATQTSVSSELSRIEIEKLLIKYGASNFAYATAQGMAMIAFSMCNRNVKFVLDMPKSSEFNLTPSGRLRSVNSQKDAYEQACRQRWRALKLVIQAKLEAVECGISIFEDEFMAHIVLPDGRTVKEYVAPQIEAAYNTGRVPALLPGFDD